MFRKKSKKPNKQNDMFDIDLMEELEYYQKPKPRRGVDQRVILGAALGLVVIIGLLLSPIFALKNIAAKCCNVAIATMLHRKMLQCRGKKGNFVGENGEKYIVFYWKAYS